MKCSNFIKPVVHFVVDGGVAGKLVSRPTPHAITFHAARRTFHASRQRVGGFFDHAGAGAEGFFFLRGEWQRQRAHVTLPADHMRH